MTRAKLPRHLRMIGLIAIIAAWAVGGVAGTGILMRYKQTPGAKAVVSERWPSGTRVALHATLPTLVMVAHPKCSCTRASVGELSKLMTRLEGRVAARVLMVHPEGVGSDWDNSDLAASAARIPGVDVLVDVGGEDSNRFGALTSGQTYLYSPEGELLFSGGITASRGHHGDNAGSKQIANIVMPLDHSPSLPSALSAPPTTPVYGCDVHEPGDPRATAQAQLQTQ